MTKNRITHTLEEHLITRQNKAEKEFLAAFESEKPALENAHVLVNPHQPALRADPLQDGQASRRDADASWQAQRP